MSGTSLDGLDVAYCEIDEMGFQLLAAETYPYNEDWLKRLTTIERASAYEYTLLDMQLGHYFGQIVNLFRKDYQGHVDAVASHGHTIFHQPELGLTTQIGDGDAIAAETGLPVVYRFRNLDVALGGQGAPLVPIGDRMLFGKYDACVNLGGICNISYESENGRRAFDICPCNMVLNEIARTAGKRYDENGLIARRGTVSDNLLEQMNSLPYYLKPAPKTLGKEWYANNMQPLIQASRLSPNDLSRTLVEHISQQIANAVKGHSIGTLLLTGGGAKNRFLAARIQALLPGCAITVPPSNIIDYKEAIIFAFLGYLRLTGKNNIMQSVTGARYDCCGGNIAGSCKK